MFVASASAKAILIGEHFVLHGAPAIAVPVKRLRLQVALHETVVQGALEGHLGFCFWTAREALDRQCSVPLAVQVKSSIPEGAGLGSSAALSLAVARAVALAFQTPTDDDLLREVSMTCERRAHGRPSGIDTEVCMREMPIWAEPGSPFEALEGPGLGEVGLVVLDSGPGAATARMIQNVSLFRQKNPSRFQTLTDESFKRALKARGALSTGDVGRLGAILDQQHSALREIGVSTDGLERVSDLARSHGAAGAKLSGAGGGGVVVAVAPVEEVKGLAERLRRAGCKVLSAGPMVEVGSGSRLLKRDGGAARDGAQDPDEAPSGAHGPGRRGSAHER